MQVGSKVPGVLFLPELMLCTSSSPFFRSVRHKSSHDWLQRQAKDQYVKKARLTSYRARSAFKLLQINERFKIFKPGQVVIDLGAAPGSWSQVAVKKVNAFIPPDATLDCREAKLVDVVQEREELEGDQEKPKTTENMQPARKINQSSLHGLVIGVDLLDITPYPGAHFLPLSDFTSEKVQKKIEALLKGRLADVVMSDMAPNASGIGSLDHDRIIGLCLQALDFCHRVLTVNGTFLCKIWSGPGGGQLTEQLRKHFALVKNVKPDASRDDSAEMFLLSTGYKSNKS